PDRVFLPPAPAHVRLSQRDPHPRDRERHHEDEPCRDRVERGRAEDDGDDPAENAECEYRSTPGGHQTGTGVCASASSTSSAGPSTSDLSATAASESSGGPLAPTAPGSIRRAPPALPVGLPAPQLVCWWSIHASSASGG